MTNVKMLHTKALQARENAYAPYSGFKVGAAVLTQKGNIYVGANVENVSYPCGTCAEEAAIGAMIAAGEYEISDIVIVSGGKELIVPCGACLQRIFEFSNDNTNIHLADLTGIQKSGNIKELLPMAFHEDFTK